MPLSLPQNALLLATYFRGGSQDDGVWASNSDQILTLSLFYTGHISFADCATRFSTRPYIQDLYQSDGELTDLIATRYRVLIDLLEKHSALIEGAGDLQLPADPTYTSCRLTDAGLQISSGLIGLFPQKPPFANWPDQRSQPVPA